MKIPMIINTDIFALLILFFTIFLAKKNKLLNTVKTKYYFNSAFVVCIVLILEMFDVLTMGTGNIFRIPRIIENTIGFVISPIVLINIIFLHNEKLLDYKKYLYIPFFIVGILSLSSWKTGWIFSLSNTNVYSRGPLFWIFPSCMLFYFIILIYSDFYNSKKYEKEENHFLYLVYAVVLIGTILQLIFPRWLLIWGSVSISLLLNYIFLRELQFKHDSMTEIYNRTVFQNDLSRLNKSLSAGIIVIDINDLKMANDHYGHTIGDEMIIHVAHAVNDCFMSIGKTYRIGGDEFCVICKATPEETIISLLKELDLTLKCISSKFVVNITTGCGYCMYKPMNMRDAYEAFSIADQRMYENKVLLKWQEEHKVQ
ncbi:MAG: GGDEF domain-containing protein [Lachnotalea sp.]